ncbi:26S proteasome non-ATPase regulatory subunit [Trichinella spiralis]|uniref:26S proteasome non-ATPase regulatory subunit n=1 Tax=Trichinella spiralis TaxID=6334 RepID=A0ABR3K8T5_TRISP
MQVQLLQYPTIPSGTDILKRIRLCLCASCGISCLSAHFEDKVKPLILANIIVQLAYTENDKEVSLELVKKVRNVVKSEDKA